MQELRDTDLLVARPPDRDVYVPLSAAKEILGHRVVLTMPATEWESRAGQCATA